MHQERLQELLLQALETEEGGVRVYETALRCALNETLKAEWREYLEQTKQHVRIVRDVMDQLGLDIGKESPGRLIVREKGAALITAMERALEAGDRSAAQLVAAECVVDAETKDHLNWELLGEASMRVNGEAARILEDAFEKVEDEEDEHLYHTMGWTRELWIEHLGMPAVLPPPEEKRDVETMAEAARARQNRGSMLRRTSRKTRGKVKRTKASARR